jgi:selenoprotein W-related protein
VEAITLVPSGGGVFEVVVDGSLVHSKKTTGRHADTDEVLAAIRSRGGGPG